MNKCTFTQTTKFTSLIPPHDENFEQIQCENMTDEQFDEYGRAYCKEHRIKVDEINNSRHKNCINKEKIIEYLIEHNTLDMELIIEYLEKGYFDNK
ncbi:MULTISPECIES: hypothetical protein [unclassified Spiroplasma]|uniref:hypothetical protein n=1 Tax=unclassified Spiroplasma TaxID=2637901 RepID=UPI0030CCBA37